MSFATARPTCPTMSTPVLAGQRPSRGLLGGAAGFAASVILLLALLPGIAAHGPTSPQLPNPLPAPAPVVDR